MLRSLGVGKKSLENRIQEEARNMTEALASLEGKPSDLENMIASFVTNVIAAVVFGHRFTLDDDALHQLTKAANEVGPFLCSLWGQLYEAFPQLMSRLPGPHQKVFVQLEYVRNYALKEVRAHEESPSDAPQDFIDLYLDQISKTKGDTDNTYNEANLVQVVLDLFFASTETTGVTLLWALLYMVKYPDIQEKVQKELADVLEPSDIIQSEHRKKLPYTDAVIHEIMRCSGVAPLGLPRQCVKDTIIQGFPLKKGTTVIYNLFSVLHDHKHWELPEVFNPSRFLDKEGNFVKNEAFIPFSTGHRICLGEQLARTELFIFFTNLLREFTFRLPEGVTKVNLDCTFGTILHPHPNKICAVPNCAPASHSA
ncbi:cytochrome P450 2J2-like [Ambystoma mexicanum]|uniref:cytochrome P450 2J2-like n=1 Tax=Ambystoma mexicanum TaxID=8296 RepID=UPI0037E998A9